MKVRYLSTLLLWLFACPGLVYSQLATVEGYVYDKHSQKPLANAHILLTEQNTRTGTTSDESGYFIFPNLLPGTYYLTVSSVGYQTHTDTLFIQFSDHIQLNLYLKPITLEAETVVVSSKSLSPGLRRSPALIRIRPSELQKVPSLDLSGDLRTWLLTRPGIISMGDRGGQLFIRGGTSVQNLILIDDIPIYQPFHIVGFYSAIPADILREAQIYPGGFSARYGGRLSSVMDIRLRNGDKQKYHAVATLSPFLSSLTTEGPVVPEKVSFITSIRESIIHRTAPLVTRYPMPYRFGEWIARVHAYLSPTSHFQATALRTHDEGSVSGDTPANTTLQWKNAAIGARYWYLPSDYPAFFSAHVYFTQLRTETALFETQARKVVVYEFSGQMTYGYLLGNWQAEFGIFGIGRRFTYFLPDERTTFEFLSEGGLYADVSFPLSSALTGQAGLRIHGFPSRGQLTVAPRLRITLKPSSTHELSIAAGRYHQAIVAAYDARDIGNVFTIWKPSPATSRIPSAYHLLVGWKFQPASFLQFFMEGYYKRLDAISLLTGTLDVEVDAGWSRGLDVELEGVYRSWQIFLGYSLSETRYLTPTAKSIYAPHDRRHQVHFLVQWHRGNFSLQGRWQFGSGFPFTPIQGFLDILTLRDGTLDDIITPPNTTLLYGAPFSRRLPAYHRLDISAHWAFTVHPLQGELMFSLINAYNRKNFFFYDVKHLRRVNQFPLLPSVGIRIETL